MKTHIPACLLFLFSLGAACLPAAAQVKISGYVKNKLHTPVQGATVTLKGANSGATTDSLGYFRFTANTAGKQTLVVSSVGYKTHSQSVTPADTGITVNVILSEDNRTLGEVVISAGAFEASDKAKGASLTPIDAMTVAGNGGDLANALRSLPGAQQIGEREGLFVRGGSSEETKQFIDGTWFKNPNYSSVPGVIQPPRINAFLFKGILFSTGGYSAQYGQAMSSALILESIDLPERSSASLSLFPSYLGSGFQQLAKDGKSSYGVNLGYSNLKPYNSIVPQRPDFFHGPEYLRSDFNFRVRTSRTGMLKMYTVVSYGHNGLRNQDVDSLPLKSSFELRNRNVYTNISYRENLGPNWRINAGAAYSYNQDKINNQLVNDKNEPVFIPGAPFAWKNRNADVQTNFAQGRIVLSRLFSRNQALHIGAEHFYTSDRYTSNDTLYPLTDQMTAAFAEGDIYIAPNVMGRVGVRLERSSLLDQVAVAPRASLAYRFRNGGQVNLAYGVFYQKPENEILFQQRHLRFSEATHYIVNYTKKGGNRLLRVEAYYKQYRKLPKLYPAISNNGKGDAKGIELFWRDKKSIRNLDYWITYTYLDTKRDYLYYPYALQPTFATPHTASVVAKRFFPDLSLNVNVAYSFATGRPYYDIRTGAGNNAHVYEQGATRNYHNINLSGAYLFTIFKRWKNKDFSGIGFGVNNILGTRQVFGYQYSFDGQQRLPLIPTATRNYYIGIFMSFGIDRTDDFIDSNL